MAAEARIVVDIPSNPTMEARASELFAQAGAIKVSDQETLDQASALLVAVKAFRTKVKDFFAPMVEAGHRAHQAALDARKAVDDKAERAEAALRKALVAYNEEVKRKAREEQDRINRELERQRKAEAEEALLAQAKKLQDSGDRAGADAVLEQEVEVAPAPQVQVVTAPLTTTSGVGFAKQWSAEIEDVDQLLRYMLERPNDEDAMALRYTVVKELKPVLSALARKRKSALAIPGVKAVEGSKVRT